jgi:hypothetical protein
MIWICIALLALAFACIGWELGRNTTSRLWKR